MLNLLISGGWLMYPLLICSIVSMAIIAERLYVLREKKIAPGELVQDILQSFSSSNSKPLNLSQLANTSPLGNILSQGLRYSEQGISIMRNRMEDQGRQITIELEKYLNTLGTIASAAPLLGLLGTVLGMIQIFAAIDGSPDQDALASGIAQALLTTAFGLFIAIPSLMSHRYFRRKIDEFAIKLEKEGQKLIDGLKAISPQLTTRRIDLGKR